MNNYFNYLIDVNFILLIFGIFYFLVLRNESDFMFKRLFILFSTILSLSLPFFQFENPLFGSGLQGIGNFQTYVLDEVIINGLNSSLYGQGHVNVISTTLNYAYWGVAIIFLQWFLFQIMQIAWFLFSQRFSIQKNQGYYLIKTNGTLPTFAFFNLLFFDNSISLSKDEKEKVILHEKTHIRQLHSVDIMLIEITKIICWFNPVVWYFKNCLQDNHEYLADQQVVKKTEARQYTGLLAKMALNNAYLPIGQHFNKSKTLKRIEMITKKTQKVKLWKSVSLVPLFVIVILVFSCTEPENELVFTVVDETATPIEGMDAFYAEISENLKYPTQARKLGIEGRVFVEMIVDKTGNLSDFKVLKGIGAGCDKAATEVIKNSSIAWQPGVHNGKKVNQKLVLPISFALNGQD